MTCKWRAFSIVMHVGCPGTEIQHKMWAIRKGLHARAHEGAVTRHSSDAAMQVVWQVGLSSCLSLPWRWGEWVCRGKGDERGICIPRLLAAQPRVGQGAAQPRVGQGAAKVH